MNALVGYTGFVGSNLYASGAFQAAYHSKNIADAFGTHPDLLVYAGVRAEKYLANQEPEKDFKRMEEAADNICNIHPKKLVLISTIDVFQHPSGVNENSAVETSGLSAYGYHRYLLECRVRERFPDALIVRLPALFGKNLKKNFIYDYMNEIPFMLSEEKLRELSQKVPVIGNCYEKQAHGYYRVNVPDSGREALKEAFRQAGFSALYFTDSRSVFQFYDLRNLWEDLKTAIRHGIFLWHPATEPVSAAEVYHKLTGGTFHNELAGVPAFYDYRTIYDGLYGGRDGYICDKDRMLEEIKAFVGRYEHG